MNGACVGWSQIVKCVGGFVVHQGKIEADLTAGFRSGMENVIFLWSGWISG